MPKKKAAGRGALGSAKARFFHPRKPIRDYLKHNYDKEALHNVLVDDKKEIRINKKVQMTYECCIKEIDEANVFSIVCCNSKAMQAGIPHSLTKSPIVQPLPLQMIMQISEHPTQTPNLTST